MSDASDSCAGTDPSEVSSSMDFWYNLYTGKKLADFEDESKQVASGSDLEADWGYVLGSLSKGKKAKRRKKDYGSCSTGNSTTGNSTSDLSEALSSISAALSLSSSDSDRRDGSGTTDGRGETGKTGEDEEMLNWVTSRAKIDVADEKMTSFGDGYLQDHSAFEFCRRMEQEKTQEPQIGMEFISEEAAYLFYKSYAQEIGFIVRKAKVQRSVDGTIRKRYIFCSRQGFRSIKQLTKETKYKRKETRTGCNAQVCFTAEDGKWVLTHCSLEHNHELLGQQHMKRATTHVTEEPEVAELPRMGSIQREDHQSLGNYFRMLRGGNSPYYYETVPDDNGFISNVFWTEGESKKNYNCFGDILILDTASKVDRHGRICTLLWGVDHHKQYTLFGCALLLDDSTNSFTWLFESFLRMMARRSQLKTIITDENQSMADAVKAALPMVHHQIGTWHIRQSASNNLSSTYQSPGFKIPFEECISGSLTREEFASKWETLVNKFDLSKNPWLDSLHQSRERWAYTSAKRTFCGGIQHRWVNETIFPTSPMDLESIIQDYSSAVKKQQRKYADSEKKEADKGWEMFCVSPMEKQAALVYTHTMYLHFRVQLLDSWSLSLKEIGRNGSIATYEVAGDGTKKSTVEVKCLDHSVECSCRKFECEGILCAHALKVLNELNIFYIPSQYILKRWTKSARYTSPRW
ncbi:Protein FAR1-RELATED SEQUENCE 7 [Linum perenne]